VGPVVDVVGNWCSELEEGVVVDQRLHPELDNGCIHGVVVVVAVAAAVDVGDGCSDAVGCDEVAGVAAVAGGAEELFDIVLACLRVNYCYYLFSVDEHYYFDDDDKF
jgi:hypothetical protein